MMIERQAGTGAGQARRTSAVEIRLVVLAVIVTLLAVLPAAAGAQEVGGGRSRLSLGEAVDRALRSSEVVDVAEAGLLESSEGIEGDT